MNTIIGVIIVLGCVVAGYAMGHGNFSILFQPAEVIIIFGSAIGALVIYSPGHSLKLTLKDMKKLFGHGAGKKGLIELLSLLYELFIKVRKESLVSLEKDVENPESSQIMAKYKHVLSDHHLRDFLCDNIRVLIMGGSLQMVAEMLEVDIESNHHEAMTGTHGIARMADGLPGLGIVAAVLGVVITMGKINEPPEVLGHHVGAALVGTFLGVLMCYGIVGPMAANLEHQVKEHAIMYKVVKTALEHYDAHPMMMVEIARREIPPGMRPTFKELDAILKGAK